MKPARWYDFISINLFWLGLNIRNNAVGAIFLPYLVGQFARPEVRNTALGEIRTAGLVIAMLVQPAMGLLSDRSTSRFGRRRPFIVAGVLLDLVFLAFMALAFNYKLAQLGYPFYPVGVYEEMDALCLSFGPPFRLELPTILTNNEVDACASQMVMHALARQIPGKLRGEF